MSDTFTVRLCQKILKNAVHKEPVLYICDLEQNSIIYSLISGRTRFHIGYYAQQGKTVMHNLQACNTDAECVTAAGNLFHLGRDNAY